MTGTWSIRIGPEVHSGLNLYRLEMLVRYGNLAADALVCSDGQWRRVDEVPYLRRTLNLRESIRRNLARSN